MPSAKNDDFQDESVAARNAHVLPFLVFMGFLALNGLISKLALDYSISNERSLPFLLMEPRYWIFPLQAVVCGLLMIYYRRFYHFAGLGKPLLATLAGVLVLLIWVSPQEVFGKPQRLDGFDPGIFENQPFWFYFTLIFRFLRLVVVVPFLEEIFWRGFLMRYLVRENFLSVPFGTFTWLSFGVVALFFGLAHSGPDFWAAVITGLLYNGLAVKTRSLGACVWAHALTNLLLGIYILYTGQWGFW